MQTKLYTMYTYAYNFVYTCRVVLCIVSCIVLCIVQKRPIAKSEAILL